MPGIPGPVLVALFAMALLSPSTAAYIVVTTCHRSVRRLRVMSAVARLLTLGAIAGVIAWTYSLGWWQGKMVWALLFILVIALLAHGFSMNKVAELKERYADANDKKTHHAT